YKTQLNFTFEGLDSVQQSLTRLNDFVQRMQEITHPQTNGRVHTAIEKALMGFARALADDLNISVALASVFEFVREINGLADANHVGQEEAEKVLELLKRFN